MQSLQRRSAPESVSILFEETICCLLYTSERRAMEKRTDIMLLPQFGSSGNPDLDMNTQGTITGLTIHTKPEELYRAILEGFAFQMKLSFEKLKDLGVVEMARIVATGGGARSDLTLQIMADVFDMEIMTLESEESGTLGCAMTVSYTHLAIGS